MGLSGLRLLRVLRRVTIEYPQGRRLKEERRGAKQVRTAVASQYQILSLLDQNNADHYEKLQEALEKGYESYYHGEIFGWIFDGLSESESTLVIDAMDMYFAIQRAQAHFAHSGRDDGRRSPAEVLGFASGVRHREEELAGREAALWLPAESLTLEHAGEPLSRYEGRVEPESGELRAVARPRLFENSHGLNRPQRRLFALDALGEGGWLKALRLEGYAPRAPRRPPALQEALFAYAEAL